MPEKQKFNTDASALTRRIEAHQKYGAGDLNQWVFDHLQLQEGLSVLDLGCGTGKQTLPMAQAVGERGHVLAVDVSEEALRTLSEHARALGLERRTTVLHSALDELEGHLEQQVFDVALGCYSLYYARDPARLLTSVRRALKPGAVLFFCGPARDNNLELKLFHGSLKDGQIAPDTQASVFMEKIGQELAGRIFRTVQVFFFQNPLRFDSPEALYGYWSSYNLYEESLDTAFKIAAQRHFQQRPVFETTKRVIGVKAIK